MPSGHLHSMAVVATWMLQYGREAYFQEQILLKKTFGRVFPKKMSIGLRFEQ